MTQQETHGLRRGDELASRYVIERPLGDGGMGQVYVARDKRFERAVAVKLLHPHVAATEDGLARFEREARTLSLIVHPNVVTVHDYGSHGDVTFLVMELVDGTSLDEFLDERGKVPLHETASIITQVANGLAEIHHGGIVHRDIKPQNIVLRELAGGTLLAKVVDFGLARDQGASAMTGAGELLGTPYYMAPEQIQSEHVDGRADFYALGVVLFEMLTGKRPFERETLQSTLIAHLVDEPPSLAEAGAAALTPSVEQFVAKALAKNPKDRFVDGPDFIDGLRKSCGVNRPDADTGRQCATCSAGLAHDAAFCGRCGAAAALSWCGTCGAPREGDRLYCGRCLSSMVSPSPHVMSMTGTPDGTHVPTRSQQVVALAGRFGGESDPMATQLLAARWHAIVEREGGRVLSLVGDSLLAAFGIGGMRPGEVESAIDAGLAMFSAAHALAAGADISATVGVEVGCIETVGAGTAWGTTFALGPAFDAAMNGALSVERGVVVGAEAYDAVRSAFQTDQIGDGRRVVSARKAVSYRDFVARGERSPHVGREVEVGQLKRLARRVIGNNRLAVAIIGGPPGSGKSRLLGEFLALIEDGDRRWHADVARCRPSLTAAPYEPFIDMLHARLNTAGRGDIAQTMEALTALPGLGEDDRTMTLPMPQLKQVAFLLASGAPHEHAIGLEELDSQRRMAFDGYVAYVAGAAATAPVLVAIEDVGHASTATMDMLVHLLREATNTPVFVLVTIDSTRSQEARDIITDAVGGAVLDIDLQPLDAHECADLLQWRLQAEAPAAEVARAVATVSGGLPALVFEAAEALLEAPELIDVHGSFICSDPAIALEVLERSEAELASRSLQRTTPSARELALAIAVAGSPAPRDMIAAMLGRDTFAQDLDELRRAGLADERRGRSVWSETELVLRSNRTANTLRKNSDDAQLKELHGAAARWLRHHFHDAPGVSARIASHQLGSGDFHNAAASLLAAANDAHRRYAPGDAFQFYESAVEAERRASVVVRTVRSRRNLAEALVGKAEMGVLIGQTEAAIGAINEALALLVQTGSGGEVLVRAKLTLGHALVLNGRNEEATEAFDDARSRALSKPGLQREAAEAAGRCAMLLFQRGKDDDAAAIANEALERWRDDDGPRIAAAKGRLEAVLGHIAWRAGDGAAADARYHAALDLFTAANHPLGAAMTVLSRGNVAFLNNDLKRAEALYADAGDRSRTISYINGSVTADTNLGHVLMDSKRVEEAIPVLTRAANDARRTGVVNTLPETLRLLAECRLRLGQKDAALDTARQAMIRAQSMHSTPVIDAVRATIEKIRGGAKDS